MEALALPGSPGSYALHLVLPVPARLAVGRLGVLDFPPGDYVYLGSACGPGGLRARLLRHLCFSGAPHWHIDYLLAAGRPAGGWFTCAPGPVECAWSQALARLPGCLVVAPGFGASDCRSGCPAHLVAFPDGMDLEHVAGFLQSAPAPCSGIRKRQAEPVDAGAAVPAVVNRFALDLKIG